MIVTKAMPISHCYGVTKAINTALEIRNKYKDKKIYFLGDLVHNQFVIDSFSKKNIKILKFKNDTFKEILNNIEQDSIVILSAHGHSKEIENYLNSKKIKFYDTTCDRVNRILHKIQNYKGEIIYIGKKGHPECEASLTYSNNIHLYDINSSFDYTCLKSEEVLILNQSTLSLLELNSIFNDIKSNIKHPIFSDEICDATRIRQQKILDLDKSYDLVVIVGDKNSSNSTKLFELAMQNQQRKNIMVNSLQELKEHDLKNCKKAYLTSGTSTPITLINEIEKYLKEL